jgi:hypothetical protein
VAELLASPLTATRVERPTTIPTALVFALGGTFILSLLHVSMPAFQIAGGILLFLQSLTLTFGRSGLSSISEGEHREAERPGDIAVFPPRVSAYRWSRQPISNSAPDGPERRDHQRSGHHRHIALLPGLDVRHSPGL